MLVCKSIEQPVGLKPMTTSSLPSINLPYICKGETIALADIRTLWHNSKVLFKFVSDFGEIPVNTLDLEVISHTVAPFLFE